MSDNTTALGLHDELKRLRELPKELVYAEFDMTIPRDHAPSSLFWAPYTQEQVTIGYHACLLLWAETSGCLVPREFQLQATLSLLSGTDCLVDVGTGYGKTLCMILPCLLALDTISMVVSPLKRLQALQVQEFKRYGVKTVAINEDTPSDPELWQVSFGLVLEALL